MEWKWTKGEPYARSRRKNNNNNNNNDTDNNTNTNNNTNNNNNNDNDNNYNDNNNDNNYNDNNYNDNNIYASNANKEIEISAYSSSLNYDENTWDILNQEVANGGFKSSNKREDLDVKIADRHLVQQRGFNPFLSDNAYADDVSVRDQYLKPQNTTQDIPK
jgi:hypothetical protein